jgi:hypothetical protein
LEAVDTRGKIRIFTGEFGSRTGVRRRLSRWTLHSSDARHMKKLLALLVFALVLPSCVKHAPRDPEAIKRSEARKKKIEDRQRRRREIQTRQSAGEFRPRFETIG